MDEQNKNIKKTVLIILAIMATILTLFLNKITTPRYLSNIELKINGLVLVDKEDRQFIHSGINDLSWLLLPSDEQQKKHLASFHHTLKKNIKDKINIADAEQYSLVLPGKYIAIVRPNGEYIAYLKPPFENHKMTLTLSSLITHR